MFMQVIFHTSLSPIMIYLAFSNKDIVCLNQTTAPLKCKLNIRTHSCHIMSYTNNVCTYSHTHTHTIHKPCRYDIMLRCWREQQQDRPSFPELRSLFDQFLTVYIQDHYPYIELQSSNHYERLVPETGQMSDEVFDRSSCGGSVCDVRIAGLSEDHDIGSVGIGSTSPSKGGFLSSEYNGRILHL